MKNNLVIFLDIDGVIATYNALEQLWGSAVDWKLGKDKTHFSAWKELEDYKPLLTSMKHYPFDEVCVYNYHRLQYYIYTQLNMIPVTVLCSSWRTFYDSIFECKDEMAIKKLNLLYLQGFTGRETSRGDEIQEYINRFEIDKFIVIDDECSFDIIPTINKEYCIEPTFKYGFDSIMYNKTIKLINKLTAETT